MPPPNCSEPSAVVETAVATLLECGLGLLGNAVALWTFFSRLRVWKPYAVYLFNLVLADLLLTLCLPFLAALFLQHRACSPGHAPGRVLLFLWALGRSVGVAFLTAVALDRYLRVVHPRLRVNLLSLRAARGISVLVWLLMVGLSHQNLLGPTATAECAGSESRGGGPGGLTWQEVLSFSQFVLPFGLILFCNAGILRTLRRRLRDADKQPKLQRARALLATVVVLFALCFLPSFLAQVLLAAFRGADSCEVWTALVHASQVASSLTGLQSVLNPVVYCFSSPAFRHSYRKVFLTLRGRGPEAQEPGCELRDSDS
ncbi:G protein-coupled receptor 31 [Phyllostomus discolor]|uniref:12-(S)-hydroxy-5,8,10,14-eicosatetraenoic acid receptor n=1 Tax=Phyllostomus discolor TaxID=89673 RepID=A0A6J2KYY5_9CHIR|nr:12-(S)-hydroxy-5,8,10,14-eicosatetraenoic acid receptor [Phyllostomus discolor]KAF6113983.1 G protein-coupled receptor 31 [Phyllostomus discolor]